MSKTTQPEGIRITRVGFWFVVFTIVVAVAATNTGNNALYMVLASMLGLLVVSGLVSRWNVRRLEMRVEVPEEIYANRPFQVGLDVESRARWFPRWLLVCTLSHTRGHHLVPFLAPGRTDHGTVDLMFERRGLHKVRYAHLWSVFPVGFFRKGTRQVLDRELIVYPELFPEAMQAHRRAVQHGADSTGRRGWGQELHSLRGFQAGDDPRSIHWKRSASSGDLVFMEREAEEGQRLAIVFDNATGPLATPTEVRRFERLVSEAASAAHHYLRIGFEIELVTREGSLGYGSGSVHRRRVLERLALLTDGPRSESTLRGTDPQAPELRLAMRQEEAA